MKGIVLAGGRATRLRPLTKITSKQLLPVYDKPMIYYPIETLQRMGIRDILIIIAPEYSGHFLNLLGSGKEFGLRFTYEIQEEPRGLADAFIIGAHFIGDDDVTLILGDNIFDEDFSSAVNGFRGGATIFGKEVPDPQRYGVVELDTEDNVLSIEEKPLQPKSNIAMVGLYICDGRAGTFARRVKPSRRGELEIADVMKQYRDLGQLRLQRVGGVWEDAGTFDSLLRISNYMADRADRASSTRHPSGPSPAMTGYPLAGDGLELAALAGLAPQGRQRGEE
jgi:glucose-1-phosphate thymidylyltransferase